MKISSNYLQAFYQLAQDLNFTVAADQLGITQSAFSQRIKNLEMDLETTLVIREKNNVHLTSAGQALLQYAGKVERLEREVLSSLETGQQGELAGHIRIGGFSSIMRSATLPALAPLLRSHPSLSIETFSVELNEILSLLKTSRVDFALFNRDPGLSNLSAHYLGTEENVLVESTKFPSTQIFLDHDPNDVTTSSYFKLSPKAGKNASFRYLDDVYGILDGVRQGLGKAILPVHLTQGMKDLRVLQPKTRLNVPLYLLYYKSPYQTRLEKAVVKSLTNYFSNSFSQ